jgi:hypothetical protein
MVNHPKTPPLPDAEVEVTHATNRDSAVPQGSMDVVISRGGKARSYRTIGGVSTSEIVKDAVKKVINDERVGEFIKK